MNSRRNYRKPHQNLHANLFSKGEVNRDFKVYKFQHAVGYWKWVSKCNCSTRNGYIFEL